MSGIITELRKYRFKKIALFDLISAFIIMIAIFYYYHSITNNSLKLSTFILWAILLTIPIGIFVHVLFGVKTQLNYRIGLSEEPTN